MWGEKRGHVRLSVPGDVPGGCGGSRSIVTGFHGFHGDARAPPERGEEEEFERDDEEVPERGEEERREEERGRAPARRVRDDRDVWVEFGRERDSQEVVSCGRAAGGVGVWKVVIREMQKDRGGYLAHR